MKKLLSFIILLLLLLSSCTSHRFIVIANDNIYYDQEAVIAYDVYNELYDNNLCDFKPIIIKK
jgi:uncharacterized protein YcfL